ncbi:MAG: TrmB family transcriptional regulator [Candidatus Hodarchaeales archaeon]|jgi:sugar-specific transcriptional regulator TrmB
MTRKDSQEITPEELEVFGLSSYESRVYLSLLPSGIRTAKEISSDSKIPFGRIYDVLSSLEDKGLVDRQESRPKKFVAKDPKSALYNLLNIKNRELESITQKAVLVEQKLASLHTIKPEESLFWSVALGEKAIDQYIEKISEAKKELNTIINLRVASRMPQSDIIMTLIDTVTILNLKGVSIKIILSGVSPGSLEEDYMTSIAKFFDVFGRKIVRYCLNCTTAFDVIDNEKVIVKVMNPVKPDEFLAWIFVWQKKFAEELQLKFHEMWSKSHELQIELK